MRIRISDFKVAAAELGVGTLRDRVAAALNLPPAEILELNLLNEGIDARRGAPVLHYQLVLQLAKPLPPSPRYQILDDEEPTPATLNLPDPDPALSQPIVVGTGPCGIFAALALALAGTRPLVLDRGQPVEQRREDYRKFLLDRTLNPDSNLLIGEGGAGTFSDGKLYTGTRSPFAPFILQTMVEAGAPPEILYRKRPHIGSDRLLAMAPALRRKIEALGGEFRFGTTVSDLWVENDRCVGVIANGERLPAPAVILASGLGSRDLIRTLLARRLAFDLKGFQLGCRIEHPQSFIDRTQYHLPSRPEALGAAEYHLVSRPPHHPHVSSFCMCPGGEVVMASAWPGQLTTNGMSLLARDGEFANAALIVTLPPDRFASPEAAFQLLENQERRLFELGGRNYDFPAQEAPAFLRGHAELSRRAGSVKTGLHPARLDLELHPDLVAGLHSALRHFDKLCPGFIRCGRLIGGETCVSSPVRFRRDPLTFSSSLPGLYLGGEGAGCAGGIMSAAADGLRLSLSLLSFREKRK